MSAFARAGILDLPGETAEEAALILLRAERFLPPEQWPSRRIEIDLPEAWEPHERDNDASGLDVYAAPEPVDYLAERRRKAVVPAGRYSIAILPDSIDTFTTRSTSGVSFTVAVTEGPWQGGEIRLRWVLDGPVGRLDGVVRRNLDLLARWTQAVRAGRATDPIDLVAKLGRASSGRRVVLDIREKDFSDRREIYCAEVEVS